MAPPATSRCVWSAAASEYEPGPDRYAWVSEASARTEPNRLFFAPLKDLPLAAGRIELRAGPSINGSAELTLTSRGYSYLARVYAPAAGVTFSRNYLDLRDGQEARITVRGLPDGYDPADLRASVYCGGR